MKLCQVFLFYGAKSIRLSGRSWFFLQRREASDSLDVGEGNPLMTSRVFYAGESTNPSPLSRLSCTLYFLQVTTSKKKYCHWVDTCLPPSWVITLLILIVIPFCNLRWFFSVETTYVGDKKSFHYSHLDILS